MTGRRSERAVPTRTSGGLLGGAAAILVVEQLVLADPARPVGWDEAIYLSQVTPGMAPLTWAASRARGITWLVFPFAHLGLSLTAIRVIVGLLAAAVASGAFWIWRREIGAAAAWAATLFLTSWLVVFYAGAIMPNLWSAIAGVAALGVAARRHAERRDRLLLALFVAAGALIRPSDAAIVAFGCCALAVASRDVRKATAAVGGLAVGFLPWLAETGSRLGSIPAAFEAAGRTMNAGVDVSLSRIQQYLAVADGPTLGPLEHPSVSPMVWLGLGALAVAVFVGVWTDRRTPRVGRWIVVLVTAAASTAQYVFVVGGVAPRFVLPSLAFASLPAGAGVASLARRRIPAIALVLLFATLAIWQGTVVRSVLAEERADVRWVPTAAEIIVGRARGRSCAVASSRDHPQLAYETRCSGRPVPVDPAGLSRTLSVLRAADHRVFVVVPPSIHLPGCAMLARQPIRGSPFVILDCSR